MSLPSLSLLRRVTVSTMKSFSRSYQESYLWEPVRAAGFCTKSCGSM